jgi:hypothetical protein
MLDAVAYKAERTLLLLFSVALLPMEDGRVSMERTTDKELFKWT